VSPAISLGVLVASAVFEGWSFAVGFREYKRVVRGRNIPLWSFIKASKDPSLYGTLLEGFSAVIGIAIAALGVIASSLLHIGWADGAASIAIGLLLFGVSAVLVNETRSLIGGGAVAGPIKEELHRVLAADSRILQICVALAPWQECFGFPVERLNGRDVLSQLPPKRAGDGESP
jgi:divalent metal cation (Fe/Co/Zn/Cd) transporter